jgi:hypothetical protein
LKEKIRRDSPTIINRVDIQASAMATPSDGHAVLEAIKDVQDSAG